MSKDEEKRIGDDITVSDAVHVIAERGLSALAEFNESVKKLWR